jgi:hypothetical protein
MSQHSYRIQTTQDDINEGVRDSSAHCIVATALGRQIVEATRISVDAQTIRFSIGEERLVYLTPRPVAAYVIAFDAGDFDKIKPITVTLSDPMVIRRKPRTASRLIVKGGGTPTAPSAPSRTRAYGQRVFRVNQVSA